MSETENDIPLVSAITLTGRNNLSDLLNCIECFKAQTYPYKELIIINNARNQLAASELNIKAEKDIFLIDTPNELTTGMARAHGMAAANGRIIAQFDVDYWHAPNRLETQIVNLGRQSAHISVLSRCLGYSFVSGRARYHENEKRAILGTMVHIRQAEINYQPDRDKNEELGFLEDLTKKGYQPISIDSPELCCKLNLTSEGRITTPINSGLSKAHFKTVQEMLTNHHSPKNAAPEIPTTAEN